MTALGYKAAKNGGPARAPEVRRDPIAETA
jgi:hypothetical protein